TACHAVGSTSERYKKRSSGGPAGTLIGPKCAMHTEVLRLPTRNLTVELRVAEERSAGVVLAHLCGLALGEARPLAHPAVAARDVERDDDAVAGLDVLRRIRPNLFDDPHRLVPQDVALVDERPEQLVEVQVGAADRGRGHADDR